MNKNMTIESMTSKTRSSLLKVNDVAEMLSVSPRTVRSWVYRRCIPSLKINGALRFNKTEIENFIKGDGHVN